MKEKFKNFKLTSAIFSVFCMIFGILLIIFPEITKLTLLYVFGAGIIILGIIEIINYFVYGYEPFGFWFGIFDFIFGLLIISSARILTELNVLAFLFGTVFIFSALIKIQRSLTYKKFGAKNWWVETVFGAIFLLLGMIIIINPFSENVLNIFLGSCIIINGIMDIITLILITNKIKQIKHKLKDLVRPVEIDIDDYDIEE